VHALCVTRHRYLSEHLARVFTEMGLGCTPCVGVDAAPPAAAAATPDVVIAEYELIATTPIAAWERDATLARTPLVAVSMRRHAGDWHLLDVNGIAGFLYLPTLTRDDAWRILGALGATPRAWPRPHVLPSVFDAKRQAVSIGES
jgi:hypothetical protein